MMAAGSIRMSRTVVEECLKWCNQRIVFGKPLIEQPVMRQKYALTNPSVPTFTHFPILDSTS